MSVSTVSAIPGTAYRRVLEALENAGSTHRGNAWTCPAHEDHSPSLSVKQGDNGALVNCHAGCETSAVAKSLGLTMADLFDKPHSTERNTKRSRPTRRERAPSQPRRSTKPSERIAEYLYESLNGDPLRRKVRLEPGPKGRGKIFLWEKPSADGDKWETCREDGIPSVLYAAPLVSEAETVHLGEGEKAADALNAYLAEHGPAGHVATCSPENGWKPAYTEALRGKRVVLWVDRDEAGEKQAALAYVALRNAGVPVEVVRAKVTAEKADAFDHLEAGHAPDQAEPFTLPLDSEAREAVEYLERFSEARTSVAYVFDAAPKPREFLVKEFLPARESGFIVAQGGAGKGHLQLSLALSLALGEDFGPFSVPKPCGVVLVSVEDDREELHRRITSALEVRYSGELGRGWREELRSTLEKRLRFVDLRGLTGAHLGPRLRDHVAETVARVEKPGLVLLDPLGRLLPPDIMLNDQAGGGAIVNELDALRDVTGCTVLAAHHVNKAAIRDGGELRASAATGSQLLADLARWVLNLKALNGKELSDYGLEHGGHYVEAAVTKTNYTPPLTDPLIFRRGEGGALSHIPASSKADRDASAVLAVLLKAGAWLTRDEWEQAAKESEDLGQHRARAARERLKSAGSLECLELRDGKRFKNLFAPAELLRPERWPKPPATLQEAESAGGGE